VHTTRDALDNCLSLFFLHLDPRQSYALDLADIGHYFRQYRRLMAHWHACFPEDLFEFNYDSLVREPRAQLQRLLEFLGLEWHEACLDFSARPRSVRTASVWQVRAGLYQRSSGRARHYQGQLGALERELAGLT
jgi:LPS sulfotransferase NodH